MRTAFEILMRFSRKSDFFAFYRICFIRRKATCIYIKRRKTVLSTDSIKFRLENEKYLRYLYPYFNFKLTPN